jgi:hypothetical protein
LVLATPLWLTGCGLEDYEAKMLKEQKRIEYMDQENYYLGPPIGALQPPAVPPAPGAPATAKSTAPAKPPIDVFLRLPKGLATNPERTTLGTKDSPLYRFLGAVTPPSNAPALAKPQPTEPGVQGFQVAYFAVSEEKKPNWKEILQSFGAIDFSKSTRLTRKNEATGATPQFDSWRFSGADKADTLVFIYAGDPYQAAVVFKISSEKTQSPDVGKAIDLSLQSLALGPEALAASQRLPRS